MSEIRKIAHNTAVQLFGKALAVIFALVSYGLMTRYLGQEGFGLFTTVYGFLAIFGILVDLGLQMTTTQLISDPRENESEIISNALTMRLVASVIFLTAAPVVALTLPYPAIVKLGIALAAAGFIFSSLTTTLTSFFQKNLIMHYVAGAEVAAKVLALVGVAAAVWLDAGLLAIIAAVIFDSLVQFLILLTVVMKKIKLRFRFDVAVWKKILQKTWPIAVTIALNLVYFKGDIFIMSLLRTQAEVGVYGAPYRILEVLINAAYLFLGLILPLLAAAAATKNLERLKQVLQASFDALIIFAVPLVVGGFFVGQKLMVAFAGPAFSISGDIIKILLLATATIFIASLFGYAVVALEKQKQMIKFYAITAAISVVGYWYAIDWYGVWGAAWMTVATELLILLSVSYVLFSSTAFVPRLTVAAKATIASAAMAGALFLASFLPLAALVVLGGAVYGFTLYAIGGINTKVISEIITIKPA